MELTLDDLQPLKAPTTSTIVLTRKEAAAIMGVPMAVFIQLAYGRHIKLVQPGGKTGTVVRVSAAELIFVRDQVANLPKRQWKGVKVPHWDALEGALNTARTLQNA